MIIEYNGIFIRYKDENVVALKEDGADVIIYLKNGTNHRLLGKQSSFKIKEQSPTQSSIIKETSLSPPSVDQPQNLEEIKDCDLKLISRSSDQPKKGSKKANVRESKTKKPLSTNSPPISKSFIESVEKNIPDPMGIKDENIISTRHAEDIFESLNPKKAQNNSPHEAGMVSVSNDPNLIWRNSNEDTDKRYLAFLDSCIQLYDPAQIYSQMNDVFKEYCMLRLKHYTLTIDLDAKDPNILAQYRTKIFDLIKRCRGDPPPTDFKSYLERQRESKNKKQGLR